MLLEALELGRSQQDALPVESTAELLSREVALPQTIVILEELEEPDSILLNQLFDLRHELLVLTRTVEVSEAVNVGRLSAGCRGIDDILKAVGVAQELCIPDVVVLIAVDLGNCGCLSVIDLESECVENLAEDLGCDLEGA